MFGWLRRSRGQGEADSRVRLSPSEIRRAEQRYSTEVVRVFRNSLAIGGIAYAGLSIIAITSGAAASDSSPTFSLPQLDRPGAGATLAVLLPLAIALQVLNRVSREPEGTQEATSVAHRQFWGGIALAVAIASAFVTWVTLTSDLVAAMTRGEAIDLVSMLGIPLGSLIATLLASDAVAVSTMESRVYGLAESRRSSAIAELRLARGRIVGRPRIRPLYAFVVRSVLSVVVATAVSASVVHLLVGDPKTTLIFCVAALIIAAFGMTMVPTIAEFAYRLQLSTVAGYGLLFALVSAAYSLQVTGAALTLNPAAQPEDAASMILVGLIVPAPTVLAAVVVGARGHQARLATPLAELTRRRLERSILRLQNTKPPMTHRGPWERFAAAAIWLSFVPLAAVPLAVIARRLRRTADDSRRPWLAFFAWALPVAFSVVEGAALVALPWLAIAAGWVHWP